MPVFKKIDTQFYILYTEKKIQLNQLKLIYISVYETFIYHQ